MRKGVCLCGIAEHWSEKIFKHATASSKPSPRVVRNTDAGKQRNNHPATRPHDQHRDWNYSSVCGVLGVLIVSRVPSLYASLDAPSTLLNNVDELILAHNGNKYGSQLRLDGRHLWSLRRRGMPWRVRLYSSLFRDLSLHHTSISVDSYCSLQDLPTVVEGDQGL